MTLPSQRRGDCLGRPGTSSSSPWHPYYVEATIAIRLSPPTESSAAPKNILHRYVFSYWPLITLDTSLPTRQRL